MICLLKLHMKCLPLSHVCASLACGLQCEKKQLATSCALEESACLSTLSHRLQRLQYELGFVQLGIPHWEENWGEGGYKKERMRVMLLHCLLIYGQKCYCCRHLNF